MNVRRFTPRFDLNYRTLVAALVVAALLDLLTTVVGLELAGLYEMNGTARRLYAARGPAGLFALTIVGVTLIYALTRVMLRLRGGHIVTPVVLYIAVGANAVAAGWNAGMMLQ